MSREQGGPGAAAGGSKGGRTTPALLRRGATREERQTRNKGKGGAKGGEDLGGRGNPWQVALEHAAKQDLVAIKLCYSETGTAAKFDDAMQNWDVKTYVEGGLAQAARAWKVTNATGATSESSRFFISRLDYTAKGMNTTTLLGLLDGSRIRYWRQLMCGYVGTSVGHLVDTQFDDMEGTLGEERAALISEMAFKFAVAENSMKAEEPLFEIRSSRLGPDQMIPGQTYGLQVFAKNKASERKVVDMIGRWCEYLRHPNEFQVGEQPAISIMGEAKYRLWAREERDAAKKEGRYQKSTTGQTRNQAAAAADDRDADKIIMVFAMEAGTTEREMIEQILDYGPLVEEYNEEFGEDGELGVIETAAVYKSSSGNTQAKMTMITSRCAQIMMNHKRGLQDALGWALREHIPARERIKKKEQYEEKTPYPARQETQGAPAPPANAWGESRQWSERKNDTQQATGRPEQRREERAEQADIKFMEESRAVMERMTGIEQGQTQMQQGQTAMEQRLVEVMQKGMMVMVQNVGEKITTAVHDEMVTAKIEMAEGATQERRKFEERMNQERERSDAATAAALENTKQEQEQLNRKQNGMIDVLAEQQVLMVAQLSKLRMEMQNSDKQQGKEQTQEASKTDSMEEDSSSEDEIAATLTDLATRAAMKTLIETQQQQSQESMTMETEKGGSAGAESREDREAEELRRKQQAEDAVKTAKKEKRRAEVDRLTGKEEPRTTEQMKTTKTAEGKHRRSMKEKLEAEAAESKEEQEQARSSSMKTTVEIPKKKKEKKEENEEMRRVIKEEMDKKGQKMGKIKAADEQRQKLARQQQEEAKFRKTAKERERKKTIMQSRAWLFRIKQMEAEEEGQRKIEVIKTEDGLYEVRFREMEADEEEDMETKTLKDVTREGRNRGAYEKMLEKSLKKALQVEPQLKADGTDREELSRRTAAAVVELNVKLQEWYLQGLTASKKSWRIMMELQVRYRAKKYTAEERQLGAAWIQEATEEKIELMETAMRNGDPGVNVIMRGMTSTAEDKAAAQKDGYNTAAEMEEAFKLQAALGKARYDEAEAKAQLDENLETAAAGIATLDAEMEQQEAEEQTRTQKKEKARNKKRTKEERRDDRLNMKKFDPIAEAASERKEEEGTGGKHGRTNTEQSPGAKNKMVEEQRGGKRKESPKAVETSPSMSSPLLRKLKTDEDEMTNMSIGDPEKPLPQEPTEAKDNNQKRPATRSKPSPSSPAADPKEEEYIQKIRRNDIDTKVLRPKDWKSGGMNQQEMDAFIEALGENHICQAVSFNDQQGFGREELRKLMDILKQTQKTMIFGVTFGEIKGITKDDWQTEFIDQLQETHVLFTYIEKNTITHEQKTEIKKKMMENRRKELSMLWNLQLHPENRDTLKDIHSMAFWFGPSHVTENKNFEQHRRKEQAVTKKEYDEERRIWQIYLNTMQQEDDWWHRVQMVEGGQWMTMPKDGAADSRQAREIREAMGQAGRVLDYEVRMEMLYCRAMGQEWSRRHDDKVYAKLSGAHTLQVNWELIRHVRSKNEATESNILEDLIRKEIPFGVPMGKSPIAGWKRIRTDVLQEELDPQMNQNVAWE